MGKELDVMFSKIAVATDGSPMAERAVQVAIDMASKYNSELTILHVLMHGEPSESLKRMAEVEHLVTKREAKQTSPGDVPNPWMMIKATTDQSRVGQDVIAALGDKIVDEAKTKARNAGVSSVDGEVLNGDAANQVAAVVKRKGIDLVVLGSRGLSPLKRVLVGSVSRNVMQEVECACLIIR